jgi:hypothetical protein
MSRYFKVTWSDQSASERKHEDMNFFLETRDDVFDSVKSSSEMLGFWAWEDIKHLWSSERPGFIFPEEGLLRPASLSDKPRNQTSQTGDRFNIWLLSTPEAPNRPMPFLSWLLDELKKIFSRLRF